MARGNEPTICVSKLNCDEMSDDVFDRGGDDRKKKMLAGELYDYGDAELLSQWHKANDLIRGYNQVSHAFDLNLSMTGEVFYVRKLDETTNT